MREWSERECELLVQDYVEMLKAEQQGDPFSKADHWRALQPRLDRRSKGSIEKKHQNLSAIAHLLGFPSIDGYKPLGNYQLLLCEVAARLLNADAELAQILQQAAAAPAKLQLPRSLASCRVSPPKPIQSGTGLGVLGEGLIGHTNFLALEAASRDLGRAGESFVVSYERDRLARAGKPRLADRVEHVALTRGDGFGFDVWSFDMNGADRFIEVKTTSNAKDTPFFITRNELAVSLAEAHAYRLYRLFRFRTTPRFFVLTGALDECTVLTPTVYAARVR